ncbi:MAG: hypothetical protein QMD46_12225 [Methanomicrobiales archaeon]|nr:hypothetical protein [Methanomicrobiales archaeon]
MTVYDEHREAGLAIKDLLKKMGYFPWSAQIQQVSGEVRIFMVKEGGGSIYVAISEKPPSLLAEFANIYEEVHAIAYGLIHSVTRLRPLAYSEIETADLSPEIKADLQKEHHYYQGVFWGFRVLVVVGFSIWQGYIDPGTILHLFGW